MWAFFFARARAVALPIPEVAPVMRQILSLISHMFKMKFLQKYK
jgi:hypothetical protein